MSFFGIFRQPYVAIIALVAASMALYIALHSGLDLQKTAFILSMAISAVLVSKAIMVMASDAPKTSILLGLLGILVFIAAITVIHAAHFKDLAIEGMALQLSGQIGVWMDAAIERSNRLRGIALPEKE